MNERLKLYSLWELKEFGIGYHTLRSWYKDNILIPITKVNKTPKFNYDSFIDACRKHDLQLRIEKEKELEMVTRKTQKSISKRNKKIEISTEDFYKGLYDQYVTGRI